MLKEREQAIERLKDENARLVTELDRVISLGKDSEQHSKRIEESLRSQIDYYKQKLATQQGITIQPATNTNTIDYEGTNYPLKRDASASRKDFSRDRESAFQTIKHDITLSPKQQQQAPPLL